MNTKTENIYVVCFLAYDTILSMAKTFSCLNIHCVFSTKERVWVLNPDHRLGFIKPFQTAETLLGNRAMAHSALVSGDI